MRRTTLDCILTTVLLSSLLLDSLKPVSGMWMGCEPCNGAECDANPKEYCPWGEVRDNCKRRICAKGPGERCGGFMQVLGDCGEGMMCREDERCHGCSLITLDCYRD